MINHSEKAEKQRINENNILKMNTAKR